MCAHVVDQARVSREYIDELVLRFVPMPQRGRGTGRENHVIDTELAETERFAEPTLHPIRKPFRVQRGRSSRRERRIIQSGDARHQALWLVINASNAAKTCARMASFSMNSSCRAAGITM